MRRGGISKDLSLTHITYHHANGYILHAAQAAEGEKTKIAIVLLQHFFVTSDVTFPLVTWQFANVSILPVSDVLYLASIIVYSMLACICRREGY